MTIPPPAQAQTLPFLLDLCAAPPHPHHCNSEYPLVKTSIAITIYLITKLWITQRRWCRAWRGHTPSWSNVWCPLNLGLDGDAQGPNRLSLQCPHLRVTDTATCRRRPRSGSSDLRHRCGRPTAQGSASCDNTWSRGLQRDSSWVQNGWDETTCVLQWGNTAFLGIGVDLKRSEYNNLVEAIEAVDYHLSTKDCTGEDVRLWVLLKDGKNKSVAYLTLKPFRGVLYEGIRDYWYPNGPDGGLACTTRGVTLPKARWDTLNSRMTWKNVGQMLNYIWWGPMPMNKTKRILS